MIFYIALEDVDLDWKYEQVESFDKMWNEGYSLEYISGKLKREVDEVALLLMDRCRKGYVEKRKTGIEGVK